MADRKVTSKPAPAARRSERRRARPPSPLLIFLPPLLISAGTVAVAAIHVAFGSPLGAAWAAEVWGLAKTFIAGSLAIAGFGGYVHANNRRAWDALDDEREGPKQLGGAHGAGGGGGGSGSGNGGGGGGANRPTSQRRIPTGSMPTATDTMRKRRTGRLTPVSDVEDADPPPSPPRQAGAGGGTPR